MTEPAALHASFQDGPTALCPFNDDTPQLFERWFADQSLVGLMGDWEYYPLPYYGQEPAEFVRKIRRTTWLVCAREGERLVPVGYTGLLVQPRHRVGILRLAIAEARYRRQGHGVRATRLALAWAFRSLDLFSVQLSVAASNTAAISLYERCGFQACGRHRLSRFSAEGRVDELRMELLQPDWLERLAGH